MKRALFVASTGQHVGKTTTCLGLMSGLRKRFRSVGFMKPVGQEHVMTEQGVSVDKDALLFKSLFSLKTPFEAMSPVLFPKGFTRDYLDGKIESERLKSQIKEAYEKISHSSDFVLIEGTGHVGVGSIVNMNNAEVASHLGVKMVVIASGGLGSSFDALALNKICCDKVGVEIVGVILNRVLPEKREMVESYMQKALDRWNIPLLGSIPYDPFLTMPNMQDYETLFNSSLLSGDEHRLRHFRHTRLISTSLERFKDLIIPSLLAITSADRDDIILALLQKHWEHRIHHPQTDFESGLILTGRTPPRDEIIEELKKASIPTLYVPLASYKAVQMITSFTAKIRLEDSEKVREAIDIVEPHIDFDRLIKALDAHS